MKEETTVQKTVKTTVRQFVPEIDKNGRWTGNYVGKRVSKGHRREEWNRPNRKDAANIGRRQSNWRDMMAKPQEYGITPKMEAGYHCPGSAS